MSRASFYQIMKNCRVPNALVNSHLMDSVRSSHETRKLNRDESSSTLFILDKLEFSHIVEFPSRVYQKVHFLEYASDDVAMKKKVSPPGNDRARGLEYIFLHICSMV